MPEETLYTDEPAASRPMPVAARSKDLIAYRVTPWPAMRLVAAPRTRDWMDASRARFAYRCLPLLMANQAGWWVLNSHPIRVLWTGGWDPSCVRIQSLDGMDRVPASGHFGEGVLTFNLPFLFRTAPGFNLHVRGPANLPKDGIQPLEGIIETDWTSSTFTMNWRLTRPNVSVEFARDEPICMLSPTPRGLLETFDPKIRDIRQDPATLDAYQEWSKSRNGFLVGQKVPDSPEALEKWQKHYFRGVNIDGSPAPEHQTKIDLKEFEEGGPAAHPPVPTVRAHPELVHALSALGAGKYTVKEAFEYIGWHAHQYCHQYANSSHGSIVGALLCQALFPKSPGEAPPGELSRQWDDLKDRPFDGLAVEAAIGTFAIACASASGDANVVKGCDILWDQKLKAILPPPPEPEA